MKQGAFVLENRNGKVIRTFLWERPRLTLVLRQDTGRLEGVESTKELEDKKIKFVLVGEYTRSEVQKKSQTIESVGSLKWVEDIKSYRSEFELVEDTDEEAKKIFKWASGIQTSVLILILLLGYILSPTEVLKPQEVVVVPPRETLKENRMAPIVRPMEKARRTPPIVKAKPKPKAIASHRQVEKQKISRARKTLAVRKDANGGRQLPQPNLKKMGALAAIGDMNLKNPGTGLSLDGMKNRGLGQGQGLGGGGYGSGKGGFSRSLYGSGLVATAPGSGSSRAEGAGGYGTKGKGGGQAGYGELSFVGASAGYLEPMEDEIMVEGGLDQDQIAAVINKNRGQIIYCYEKGLQLQSRLSGRVAVDFVIGTRGGVNRANVAHSSLRNTKVEDCILQKLKSWKFPKPVGNVQVNVSYPFVLRRLSQN